ncbi:uncharacterized protein LOC117325467 [Pecten maximus]|uniref:uncharacterized protein LOC117325467 n=1 Tax=Pecten maximus TaxID=6579 RepID=UPI00145824EF|nr:uncharacterized protein LOC117325467 [Pecten maximus]XP_033737574.1 uncharacterized protein LOC117325467 [Pecten maximus]
MSKEITRALGVGILGFGLGYIGYKIFTNSSSTSIPNSSSRKGIIKPLGEKMQQAWSSDSKRKDICILHTDKDFEKVEIFRQNIYRHCETEDLNVDLNSEMGHGMTILEAFKKELESSIYIFVFVTENFYNDQVNAFLASAGLIDDLRRFGTLWRLVPVWADPRIKDSEQCPFELSVLQGLHYDVFLENEQHTSCFKNIDTLLRKGRKKEQKEDMKRELEDD